MTDELKPVRCGCGGEAEVVRISSFKSHDVFTANAFVVCKKCKIETAYYSCDLYPYISKERAYKYAESEAIEAWNKAMGKPTAKVKDFGHPCGTYGYCSNCGGYCVNEEPYCPHCGAKLDWI